VLLLYGVGAGGLASCQPLARRLPATGTTAGVVGALIVATAAIATRLLGEDFVGAEASLLVALTALSALIATGIALRPTRAAVGEVSAGVGAGLGLLFLATAPAGGALGLEEPWAWWSAATLTVGGLALLLTARRSGARSWPLLAVVALGFAGLSAGVAASEALSPQADGGEAVVFSVVFVLSAAAALADLAVIGDFRLELSLLAGGLAGLAIISAVSAAAEPAQRPAAAALLVVTATGLVAAPSVMNRMGAALAGPDLWVERILAITAVVTLGVATGFLVAPWVETPYGLGGAEVSVWMAEAWPPWRGWLAGILIAGLVAAVAFAADRSRWFWGWRHTAAWGLVPLAAGTAALLTWLAIASDDRATVDYQLTMAERSRLTDVLDQRIGTALAVIGVALFALTAIRWFPRWGGWVAAASVAVAAPLILQPESISVTWGPEI